MNQTFTLALIAHDRKKVELANFILQHRGSLTRLRLLATRGTGTIIQKQTGLRVELLEHGPAGGDRQIGQIAADNGIQAVIFFRDPVSPGPHEPDFAELLTVCDAQEIPFATNPATAQALLHFLQTSPDRGVVSARPWAYVEPEHSTHRTGSALPAIKQSSQV